MKYYIPENRESKEDAREVPGNEEIIPYWFARDAAEYEHNNCDMAGDEWPAVFAVIDKYGKEYKFKVERDFDPVFTPMEIKEGEGTG